MVLLLCSTAIAARLNVCAARACVPCDITCVYAVFACRMIEG
eukprot:COSAG01_NODE_1800_length_9205_cov_18.778058_3_plen_42_part_00